MIPLNQLSGCDALECKSLRYFLGQCRYQEMPYSDLLESGTHSSYFSTKICRYGKNCVKTDGEKRSVFFLVDIKDNYHEILRIQWSKGINNSQPWSRRRWDLQFLCILRRENLGKQCVDHQQWKKRMKQAGPGKVPNFFLLSSAWGSTLLYVKGEGYPIQNCQENFQDTDLQKSCPFLAFGATSSRSKNPPKKLGIFCASLLFFLVDQRSCVCII